MGGLSVATALTPTLASGQDATGESWTQFGYDSLNTGVAPNTGPVSDVTESWAFKTEGAIIASPAVVGDTVYVGSDDGTLYALSVADGTERWRFETADVIQRSSPAVHDGVVYVGSRNGNVHALTARDGVEQWRFESEGVIERSSPTIVDGVLYVGALGGTVYALSAADGAERWRARTDGEIRSSPAVAGGNVYICDGNGVSALSVTDGTEQWHFETPAPESSPTVVDDTVYVGSTDGGVYALSTSDGTEQWRFETGDEVSASPAVVGETLYVGSHDETVYALSATDGTERWRFETGGEVRSSPAVTGETLYVGSHDGRLYALSTADGTRRWAVETDDIVVSSPAVADGSVYVGSYDQRVYAVAGEPPASDESAGSSTWAQPGKNAANTGALPGADPPTSGVSERWRVNTGVRLGHPLAVTDGTVYVVSEPRASAVGEPRTLSAIDAGSGAVQWDTQPARGMQSQPVVRDGTVYLASIPTGAADGAELSALSADDGVEQWRTETAGADLSVVVAGRTLYAGDENGTVTARSTADGTERWRHEARGSVLSLVTTDDTVYVVRRGTGALTALRTSDGVQRWRETMDVAVTSLAVAGETVYALTGDGPLLVLSATDGTERRRLSTGGERLTGPTVTGDTVYVGSTDGGVYALSTTDWARRWRFETDAGVRSPPAVAGDTLFVGTDDGTLFALSTTDGTERWRFRTGSPIDTAPVVAGDTVYVASSLGTLSALSAGRRTIGSAGVLVPVSPPSGSGFTHLWEWQAALAGVGALGGGAVLATGARRVRRALTRADASASTEPKGTDSSDEPGDDETATTEASAVPDRAVASDDDAATGPPDAATDEKGRSGRDRPDEPATDGEVSGPQDFETSEALRAFVDACPAVASGAGRLVTDDGPLHRYVAALADGGDAVRFDVVAPEYADDESLAGEFEYVVRKWRRVSRHDGVVPVVDDGAEPRPWVASQPTGPALASTVSDTDVALDGRLSILHTVSNAVRTAARSNVSHPTLSPRCIHIEEGEATVSDWGLRAVVRDVAGLDPAVTPYTAPEQLPGGDGVTQGTTVYRLAAVAYALVTGQPPYADVETDALADAIRSAEPRPPSAVADVPPAVDDVFESAFSSRPTARPGMNFVYRLFAQFD